MIPSTAHHPAEPAEREDPVNGLLDSLETLVTTLVEMGLEPHLRARIARLLPVPTPSVGGTSRLASGDPSLRREAGTRGPVSDVDRAIGLANAAAFCERAGRAARSAVSRRAAESHAAVLRAEIDRLRAGGGDTAPLAGASGRLAGWESDAPNDRRPS